MLARSMFPRKLISIPTGRFSLPWRIRWKWEDLRYDTKLQNAWIEIIRREGVSNNPDGKGN